VATPCLDGSVRFQQGSLCGEGRGSGVRERHEITFVCFTIFSYRFINSIVRLRWDTQ
jgi:hypothetical protein